MTRPVNLNKYRKTKSRAERKARADENAIKFGLTKAQKQAAKCQNKIQALKLDGHKKT